MIGLYGSYVNLSKFGLITIILIKTKDPVKNLLQYYYLSISQSK